MFSLYDAVDLHSLDLVTPDTIAAPYTFHLLAHETEVASLEVVGRVDPLHMFLHLHPPPPTSCSDVSICLGTTYGGCFARSRDLEPFLIAGIPGTRWNLP